MYPAASLNMGQAMQFNFGSSPFIHPPSDPLYKGVLQAASFTKITKKLSSKSQISKIQNNSETTNGAPVNMNSTNHQGISSNSLEINNFENTNEGHANASGDMNRMSLNDDENELGDSLNTQRQSLIENLINMNMGFPVELCVRAAHNDAVNLDGNLAISWYVKKFNILRDNLSLAPTNPFLSLSLFIYFFI